MFRLALFFFFFLLTTSAYSQNDKLAELVIQSFAKKDYKLLFPRLVPDSLLFKSLKDSITKDKKLNIATVIAFRMLEEFQWEDYRKAAKKNKIDFRNLVIKEALYPGTNLVEGKLYIHYAVGERNGLMTVDVYIIAGQYYLEFFPDAENAFIQRDIAWIEEQKTKCSCTQTKPVSQ